LLTGLLLAGSLIAIHQAVRAADPVTYDVTLTPTGNAAIDSAAHDASTLIALRSTAPAGPFALIARARGDVTRFQTVLNSFGYYAGQASITIDRRPLDDAGLTEALDAVAAATKVPVVVTRPRHPARRCAARGQERLPARSRCARRRQRGARGA
jgi:translocation and assembly module TamA